MLTRNLNLKLLVSNPITSLNPLLVLDNTSIALNDTNFVSNIVLHTYNILTVYVW